MKYFALITIALGSIIQYNFKNSVGQVTSDLSGNNYYAVLGQSLLKENSDPLPTDRGLYFTASSLVTLPPNAIQPTKIITLTNFYLIFYLYPIAPGRIFTVNYSGVVKISIESLSSGTMEATQYVSTQSSVSETLASSKKYLDTWVKVIFTYKFIVSGLCFDVNMRLTIGSLSNAVTSGTPLLNTEIYEILIGDNGSNIGFNGFISEFYIFENYNCVIATAVYIYASFPEENPNPYTSSSGSSCNCESYSCTGASLSCIKCNSECGEYCKTSSTCLNIIEICKPYAIINRYCNVTFNYLQDCIVQESSTLCIECDSGYNLSTDRSTCCLSGQYMVSSQVCAGCDSTCSECVGPTIYDCVTCSDPKKFISGDGSCVCILGLDPISGLCLECLDECSTCVTSSTCTGCYDANAVVNADGRCECNLGYYNDPGFSGISCLLCHLSCFNCTGPESSNCIYCSDPNASLVNGLCLCNSNFYLNTSTGICESCYSDCLDCISGSPSGCTNCTDLNAELLTTPGICSCKSGYAAISSNPLICNNCHQTCGTCSGLLINQCTSCKDPLATLVSSSCICDLGFFYTDSFTCSPCHPDCIQCSNFSQDSCLSCKPPHSLLSNNSCICEVGYTATNKNPLYCEPCHTKCETCSGISNSDCLTCKDENAVLKKGYCNCIEGFYYNETSNNCEKCPNNCTSCDKYGACDSCDIGCKRCENNFLCLECGRGYFLGLNFECVPCFHTCKTCYSESEIGCLSCSNAEIIIKDPPGRCDCLQGEYMSNLNPLECSKCLNGCSNCTEFECLNCDEGYVLINGKCNRIELKLDLDVLANNTIIFYFSEFLLTHLKPNDFITTIEGQVYVHTLEEINRGLYELNIKYTTFKALQQEVIINFISPIQGESKSLLMKLNYNCILIKPNEIGYTLTPLLSSFSNTFKYTVIGSGITSMFINSNQGSIWITFNTIQTLSYIPLINVKIPDFLKFFLIGVRPITVFPNFWKYFGILTCDTPEISGQFYSYGFTCKNFLLNCGEFILIFSIGIALFILLSIIYIFSCKKCKVIVYRQLQKFRYSFFIRFWIQSYVELMLATVIAINFLSIENTYDKINSTVGFIVGLILFASPIYLVVFYKFNHFEIAEKKEDFIRKYSPLIIEFDLDSPFRLHYSLIFIGKIIFMFTMYNLEKYPYSQVITCFFIQVFNIVFMIKYKVLKSNSNYKMYIFQESIILCVILMIAQFFFGYSETVLKIISYAIIGVVGVGIGIGSLSSILDLFSKVKEFLRKRQLKNQNPVIKVGEADDSSCDKENSASINDNIKKKEYIQVVPYNSNFHSPSHSMVEEKSFMIITH